MATVSYDGRPAKTLRAWAKAYQEAPIRYRFPSDPNAEFFPRDMEDAAGRIDRLENAIKQYLSHQLSRQESFAVLRAALSD